MYAVIFIAETINLDKNYHVMADKMRELAMDKYDCTSFTSVTEGSKEITISYWKSQQQISAWKQDKEHIKAQNIGKKKWYKKYDIQVVKVLREYSKATS